jgi:hypothetical protein
MSNSLVPLTAASAADASSLAAARGSGEGSVAGAMGASSAQGPVWTNPALTFDAALGIVVMEFRDWSSGRTIGSIPSARQLAAYRSSMGGDGEPQRAASGADGDKDAAAPAQAASVPAAAAPAPAQAVSVAFLPAATDSSTT